MRLPDPDTQPQVHVVAGERGEAELAGADRALAGAEADLAEADAALEAALAAARGAPSGSAPWASAQLALSRLWEACTPAAATAEALAPLAPADPPGPPPRAAPQTQARIDRAVALVERCEARAERARAALAR